LSQLLAAFVENSYNRVIDDNRGGATLITDS